MSDKAQPADKVGLPIFAYHPDPLATGSVREGPECCVCCGRERGYVYTASVYSQNRLENELCPWCIADGSAAEKFDATFSDDHALVQANLPEQVIEEVTRRTPGYASWQGEDWQSCCQDACEFHGNISRQNLLMIDPAATEQFLAATRWSPEQGQEFVSNYQPGGSPSLYHFACRHCCKSMLTWDCD